MSLLRLLLIKAATTVHTTTILWLLLTLLRLSIHSATHAAHLAHATAHTTHLAHAAAHASHGELGKE